MIRTQPATYRIPLFFDQDRINGQHIQCISRERLANLNRKLHEKIKLEIIDLKNALGEAIGTMVTFGIPVGN